MFRAVLSCLLASTLPAAANAAILNANPANLLSVFASAKDGDTIVAEGTFGSLALQNRAFTTRVTLDATRATFADTLTIQNVSGLNVLRGTFGSKTAALRSLRAVAITNSTGVKFQNSLFLGNGATAGSSASFGMTITLSKHVQISAGHFESFRLGIGVNTSNNVKIDSSKFVKMTSDGINIANSHFVTATANTCSGTVPHAGAHPDCIQLWSMAGNPVQSNILLQRNIARGATQGFASFNAADGGGLRISMINNIVETSYPQGIACYSCVDSIFTGNTVSTLPGAMYRTSINIVGGANNIIANNSVGPHTRPDLTALAGLESASIGADEYFDDPIDPLLLDDLGYGQSYGSEAIAALAGDGEDALSFGQFDAAALAVPEPGIWAQLVFGFGLVGGVARRRVRAAV